MTTPKLLAQAPQVPTDTSVFGTVQPPAGTQLYNEAAGGIGLLLFISNMIRLATVVAGIYVLINFVLAGYDYITAGDSKAGQKVRERMTSSVLGLVVIVASYVIIGLAGLIFFGRASYFINPDICGPTDANCIQGGATQ